MSDYRATAGVSPMGGLGAAIAQAAWCASTMRGARARAWVRGARRGRARRRGAAAAAACRLSQHVRGRLVCGCVLSCVWCVGVCALVSRGCRGGMSVGHCRTSGQLCRTVGLSDCRTLGMTPMTVYDSGRASNHVGPAVIPAVGAVGLSDCRTVGLSDFCRTSVGLLSDLTVGLSYRGSVYYNPTA